MLHVWMYCNKKIKSETEIEEGKEKLREIVAMLVGLIKANSGRVHESSFGVYSADSINDRKVL